MKMRLLAGLMPLLPIALSGQANAQAPAPQQAAVGSNYFNLRLTTTNQEFHNMVFENPRIGSVASAPNKERKTTGSVAIGAVQADGWRTELEYSFPQKGRYDSRWSPFATFTQRVETTSYRLMGNLYKDFDINQDFSWNVNGGLGLVNVKTRGYQSAVANSEPTRPFEQKSRNNLAWSLGLGFDYKINKAHTFGLGYRFVDMGRAETGMDQFNNPADERYRGILRTDDVSLTWRIAY